MLFKKNKILLFLLLLCCFATHAQVQTAPPMRQVFGTTGHSGITASGYTIDYTVGECMVTTVGTFTNLHLTQGFQQPNEKNETASDIELHFYSGITPNGDENNEVWQIDGITNFPENSISIFNRWGNLVWNKKNYDNVKIVWDGKNNKSEKLPDATYFYVADVAGKTFKGWVELTH